MNFQAEDDATIMDELNVVNQEPLRRPPNAFYLFMKSLTPGIYQENADVPHEDVDKLIGRMWAFADENTRNIYREQAHRLALEFKALHPDFVETIRRKRKSNSSSNPTVEPIHVRVILNDEVAEYNPLDANLDIIDNNINKEMLKDDQYKELKL